MRKTTVRAGWETERALLARGVRQVVGVDEAGRGPLAGPVVAAAVGFPAGWIREGFPDGPDGLAGLDDSKRLTPGRRERLFGLLTEDAEVTWAVSVVDVEVIDRLNILRATHRAMNGALQGLAVRPDGVLVDGLPVPGLVLPHVALVGGDGVSGSIAAASVLAKVFRDRWMDEADRRWPGYGFGRHRGYPTPSHLEALRRLGPCPAHRRSFEPVRRAAGEAVD